MERSHHHSCIGVVSAALLIAGSALAARADFDHTFAAYARLLGDHVVGSRVDYAAMLERRGALDAIVDRIAEVEPQAFDGWTSEQRLAYWINAYNILTLRAIVDHYPIEGSWFSLSPRNSIRQIDGVWDVLEWRAGGRQVTLDGIEHDILRPTFEEARIHFAINCASLSCPPLRPEPYIAERIDEQLAEAARSFLASPLALQVDGTTLRVSSIFDWYGEDFIPEFAASVPGDRPAVERAILGVVAEYGSPAAATLAADPRTRIRFLDYDWSLNDVVVRSGLRPEPPPALRGDPEAPLRVGAARACAPYRQATALAGSKSTHAPSEHGRPEGLR